MVRAMFDMFDTPLKGAALGFSVVALWVFLLSYSDFLLRIFDDSQDREVRDARRLRFRTYAVFLLGIALAMILTSRVISG